MYEAITVRQSVKIEYIRTAEMVADVLTKPLGGCLFYKFAYDMMGKSCDEEKEQSLEAHSAGVTGVRCEKRYSKATRITPATVKPE